MSKSLAKLKKPPSDLTKYDNEPYMQNPLLTFRLSDVKDQKHFNYLKKKAAQEKIKLARLRISGLDEDTIPKPEIYYQEKLKEHIKKIPIPKMLEKTDHKIKSFAPNNLKTKFPFIVKAYMEEVHQEYDRLMRVFSCKKILKNPCCSYENPADYEIPSVDFNFKYIGKTNNYPTYLANRHRLKKNLLIIHPFVRAILDYSVQDFPDVLNEFDKYNANIEEPFVLPSLVKQSTNDLYKRSYFIRWSWFPRIVAVIKRYYKKKGYIEKSVWTKAFRCIDGLVIRQVTDLRVRTLNHLIDCCSSSKLIPHLKINLECDDGGLDLNPSYEMIEAAFCRIATEIREVSSILDPIAPQVDPYLAQRSGEMFKLNVNDIFFEEIIDKIKTALRVTYAPIREYVQSFQNRYYALYSKEMLDDIDCFLREPREFKEYFEKIESYFALVDILLREPQREFFEMALINNAPAIKKLREITDTQIDRITKMIVEEHMKEEHEICRIFEALRQRALEVPRTTEQLMANGEYMLRIKTKDIFVLSERIQKCLQVGTDLVSLTEMSEEHIALTITTISWLVKINEVFETNATNFETYKGAFEEHLQEVIKKLVEDIDEMIPKLAVLDDMSDKEKFTDYYFLLQNFMDQIKCLEDYVKWINKEEKLFKMSVSSYPNLEVIKDFVFPFSALMKLCVRWKRYYFVWMDGPFEYLEPKFVEETVDDFHKEFMKNQKFYRNKIKQDLIANPILKFKGQTEDPDATKHPCPLRLTSMMLSWIKDFGIGAQIVNIMCNPALRKRHWIDMSEIAGFDLTPDAGTTLRKIINFGLQSKLDSLEIISVSANKELQLQMNLYAMIKEWDTIMFPHGVYRDTDLTILLNCDDIQTMLDDHILKTLTMRGSAFMKPCEQEVLAWYDKLIRLNSTLDNWARCQANYLYLTPIFSSKDIVAQMPEEGRLFIGVDQIFRRSIGFVIRQPLVIETGPSPGLLESMEKANEMLENISVGVNNYLERKRLFFSRFFFLSNDEMLEILSETRDPLRVQPHLCKCFEGIYRLEFTEAKDVLAMISSDQERINFVTPISTAAASGSVEKWLARVEEEMLIAVQNENAKSFSDFRKRKRSEWVCNWPQMIVLCVSQIYWALNVHSNLNMQNQNLIKEVFKQLTIDLNEIVALIRSKTISNLNRITIKSLIVIDVHAKDVIADLVQLNVCSETDFNWLSQLRYYWEEGTALVRIINATVPFANEYLGNSDRLVITPLTDRCYRTLIGAYQLHLNGAPEGPAGTGKTETTKDLAKALAVQCKVFNCSDGLDYKAMGKFFKGLAACGAWACFDEFNRIELEVLSVIGQQILSIIQAIRTNLSKFVFEGTELKLNPACYVCITMNPGYAGRSELPDNLKVLFRSVAMMVPDYAMIGEISLYSFGFIDARKLAVKIVTTYRLCSEQLSSQNHYDYGMRAVKTVLSACGNIKKAFPDEDENVLLLRCLLDVNLPKFLSFDIPLFEGIISDLFPAIKLPQLDYSLMEKAFKEACQESNLQPIESFFIKIIQTYEMMIVRHGFMLVGDPMAGKTKTLQVLAAILEKLKNLNDEASKYYQKTEMGIVNPKSITIGQLYGAFDSVSYEWTDGIVATIFRAFAMDSSLNRKWVIFDGPVDAVWIENLNTVLDDNKKLCLTSGEVIAMSPQMSMIFEVMDLSQASPATVSRCGMIYMEPKNLGWKTFALSWLNKCDSKWADENGRDLILQYLDWLVEPSQTFIRRNCSQLLNPGEFSVLRTTFELFDMFMAEALDENPEEYTKYLFYWIPVALMNAVNWGIGGILDIKSREKFDEFQRSMWTNTNEQYPMPRKLGNVEIIMPGEGLIFDYLYVFKQKGQWRYWPDIARKQDIEITPSGYLVKTIDTGRYMYILDLHFKHNKKLLFVGPTGTGKSFYVQNMILTKLSEELYTKNFITFTVMMTANQTQDLVLSKLIKRRRGFFGPPKGQIAAIFVDDMNMPAKEKFGAQPPLELLRQYFDYGHWYDLKDTTKVWIQDTLMICACAIPGGSRQDVYARFLSHFNIFSINEFAEITMNRIFVSILSTAYKNNGHTMEVNASVKQIVDATLIIYKLVQMELLPTPSKAHYIFNIRDIARVIGGCSLLKKESVDSKTVFPRIWYHEAMRIFYDRLVDNYDYEWMFNKLNDCLKECFNTSPELAFENYLKEEGSEFNLDLANKIIFGSYLDEDVETDDKKYEEVQSVEVFYNIAFKNLEEYNSMRKTKMDISLFTYALQHLNKICRVMSMQGSSALLVGIGGSGRQSLCKLGAQINSQSLYQPEITKNYGANDWHDDLKAVLKEAGGLGKHTTFLMTENQIKMELFLEDIDCLLNTGEVPNMYAIDEKQEILDLVRLAAQGGNRNLDVSPLQVFSYFVNRCHQKLHIMLCLSPIGSSLRTRIRLYPSLVNCCTIDWFQLWPEEALTVVAERCMNEVELEQNIKDAAVVSFQYFHTTANKIIEEFYKETGHIIYITSASFLELIKSFQLLIERKMKDVMDQKTRYLGGLETLKRAAATIAIMSKELNDLQPKLVKMAENSQKMMEEISVETIAATAAAEQVKKDEIVAKAQAEAAEILKSECEKDLAKAIPVLEEALQALNTLKPSDITLVKSMKNPPSVIKLVLASVCVIKGISPDRVNDPTTGKMVNDYWGPSKRLLGDMNFLQSLKDFDKDNIHTEIMKKIRKDYIPNPEFQPKIVAKASSAAEGLCKWVIAMDLYDAVAKVVAPKKAKLADAEKEYADTMQLLNEKRELAAELERNLVRLNEELDKANMEMKRTKDEVEFCQTKLTNAETLISGLGGENERWTKSAENLQLVYDHLPGDILISCGIIAYLATITAKLRCKCIEDWFKKCKSLNIPCSDKYVLLEALGSSIKVQNWNLFGLPRDPFSTENAIIMDNSRRYSLFIDPQGQANKWIKNMERINKLTTVKFSQSDYMKIIEKSIEVGTPVLIENIMEELEVPLDPILNKNIFKQGAHEYISLGDNIVMVSPKFRLYMTSNLRNPHFLPEIYNKVTIINFALTQSGLEDQLLSIVVAKERPDLEELRQILVTENAENRTALKGAEDMILLTLSGPGNILENQEAIDILEESKKLSVTIQQKQETSKVTEAKIDTFRLNYKTVARHSSVLYYTITDLPNIDPMYQFSLNWYINLYIYSIENANKSKDIGRRIKFLIEAITLNLYSNICRSIFEKDKLLYSFILATQIMIAADRMDSTQLLFFLTGGVDVKKKSPNPNSTWISEIMWNAICNLEQLNIFKGITNSFKENSIEWKAYYDHAEPQSQLLPDHWHDKTSGFEKIIILKAIRPDKVCTALKNFITVEIGQQFVQPPPFDIAKSYEDSNCLSPLIFILSPGSDPMSSLVSFAEKIGFDEQFQSISLGQGQGPIAQRLIEDAQESGYWVCLQNCHLASSWLPTLEILWEKMDVFNTDPQFRIWLTAYPFDNFPVALLQNSVKMTNEPPTGLQQNLLRSYNSEPVNDEKFYLGCPSADRAFTRLLYGICFFHAVVQERRKFGSLGWNIAYGFNESDFQISVQQLLMLLNQYEEIPFAAISYLTAECNYGGRVTDEWDRRSIVTILKDYVNNDVVCDMKYRFADDDIYILPRQNEHREIIKYIEENIPTMPPPEVYGLHSNAGIVRDLQTSKSLIDCMILTQGKGTTACFVADNILLEVVTRIEESLPEDFNMEEAKKKYPVNYNESMNTVLIQEMDRFTKLLKEIKKSCSNLKNAIKGNIVLTPELEEIIIAINSKKVPTVWMKKSYPNLKPLASYIQDFLDRLNWLEKWFLNNKPPTFWLSGFFFTQSFLTGALQNYARKYKIPIDALTFDFEVLKAFWMETPPEDGVYINGLFLEGSNWSWENNGLVEQSPKILFTVMPAFHFYPILIKELQEGSRYRCPLYKTAERKGTLSTTGHSTNFVLSLLLNTKMPASHWIKRSTALICQTSS
ncbi:dynein axonemal heavy chain 12 [Condylostylus longicornis]|uniref:dynein axonemal heavy chain 12 n=1 Tax=Condylostylus longicornis TaxID=2530218 RepID=UPI00244E075A|nr:dynein axonemal heavy chain 12 [Condylostylus longicornis]